MSRFTITQLRKVVEEVNDLLAGAKHNKRLIEHGRNGYQAVDLYPVDENGFRIGTGVSRVLCTGTSRECACECWNYLYSVSRIRAGEFDPPL